VVSCSTARRHDLLIARERRCNRWKALLRYLMPVALGDVRLVAHADGASAIPPVQRKLPFAVLAALINLAKELHATARSASCG
jgi:hypothetical protein